jgi:hypothetical protein
LNDQADQLGWVEFRDRSKQGAIKLTPLDAAPEPKNLRALKSEIRTRRGTVPLIDMLKEAVLRTGWAATSPPTDATNRNCRCCA